MKRFLDHLDDLLIALGLAVVTAGLGMLHPVAALLFVGGTLIMLGAVIGGRMAGADNPEEEDER